MSQILPTDRAALIAAVAGGSVFRYLLFWGHRQPADGAVTKSCFSQWYGSPFTVDRERFPTAEHYMMVRKCRLFGDEEAAQKILSAQTPNDAKALGRKARGFSEALWLAHREDITLAGNIAKFEQNQDLGNFLLNTCDAILVESSPVDAIWGIGLAHDHASAQIPSAWPGLNLLGFTLMKVRDHLRLKSGITR